MTHLRAKARQSSRLHPRGAPRRRHDHRHPRRRSPCRFTRDSWISAHDTADSVGRPHRRDRHRGQRRHRAVAQPGSRTVNVVPRPTSLSAVTEPPIASVSCFTIARPRPGADLLVRRVAAVEVEAVEGALEVLGRDARAGVGDAHLGRARAVTVTLPPAGVERTAFSIRFASTCSTRSGSAVAGAAPFTSATSETPTRRASASCRDAASRGELGQVDGARRHGERPAG